MNRLATLVCALAIAAAFPAPAASTLMLPDDHGPDVIALTHPVATRTPFNSVEFSCAHQGVRTATVSVPNIAYDRVLLVVTIVPDGDPWDRLFGVAINGVEVMRGTTPRTRFTLRKDITEFAPLLPRGGTEQVSLMSGSFVGRLLETVQLKFYVNDATAHLVRGPAKAVVPGFLWKSLSGDGTAASAPAKFGPTEPKSVAVELTLSGHGESGEFWYLDNPKPRVFHVLVDGHEIGVARAMPYTYALLGFGGPNANVACAGPGTSAFGNRVHPLMWWTVQQVLDLAGVHLGVGEIPPYRMMVAATDLPLLTGARTVTVRQQRGDHLPQDWPTSLSFLIER